MFWLTITLFIWHENECVQYLWPSLCTMWRKQLREISTSAFYVNRYRGLKHIKTQEKKFWVHYVRMLLHEHWIIFLLHIVMQTFSFSTMFYAHAPLGLKVWKKSPRKLKDETTVMCGWKKCTKQRHTVCPHLSLCMFNHQYKMNFDLICCQQFTVIVISKFNPDSYHASTTHTYRCWRPWISITIRRALKYQ
jgi:hypothetical protein